MIYDNLKTVVDAILVGKERHFNRRFMAPPITTCSNRWPARRPLAGRRGKIENQVGNVREWLFTPKARFPSFAALNDWLASRCRELAQRKHPVEATRTIADRFLQEGPLPAGLHQPFDGYIEQMMRVSSTCLVRVERTASVPADFAGKVVSVRLYADQVRIVAERKVIAEHERRFGRAVDL